MADAKAAYYNKGGEKEALQITPTRIPFCTGISTHLLCYVQFFITDNQCNATLHTLLTDIVYSHGALLN